MAKLLWAPSDQRKKRANMTRFTNFVNEKHSLSIDSYDELYQWSIDRMSDFWAAVWEFTQIKASQPYDKIVDDLNKFPGARWFSGAKLNFAENLLRYRDDHIAFIFRGETQKSAKMTYAELYHAVAYLACSLRQIGVKTGDRVAAYMPNMMETAIAMLATTSIGAVWSSCATDLGAQATLDRLGQIEPKVLFTVDGYYYKGKTFDSIANAGEVARNIPSLEKVIVVRYAGSTSDISHIPKSVYYDQFIDNERQPDIHFKQLPFEHPAFIVFSSGTTGKPKCMVQGAGGVLINHLKELIIHGDLKQKDTIFYITTCSWVMWNWLLSSLAVGATVVLYDGNPNYPDPGAMWQLIQEGRITIFGTSATYINYLKGQGLEPGKHHDLSSLREISQTGSTLSADGFEYVYQAIKEDLHFNSISGGTEIQTCFVNGTPTLPVYAGELQCWALGVKANCYDENGNPVVDQMGELICEAPMPSMPLYFWNDPGNKRYKEAYFSFFQNVWRHGDYIMIHSDTKGITFSGRSDAVLKPSGVRIGTAEIYYEMDKLAEVADSLAIGQTWNGDQRIVLFVKLAKGYSLTDELKDKIKTTLRENASPRHVPALIIEAPDIPYTLNMKKVELAVTNIMHDRPVLNRDALMNPESLDYYESIAADFRET